MRAVKLFLALLFVALGAGLIAVGIGGIQTFGSEGRLNLESPVLESGHGSYALVIDVADVDTGLPWSERIGETTIGARSTDQGSLFVGLAATPDLDEYLRGVPYDVVRNEGSGWQLSTVPGTHKPDPPRAERFWTRRGTGSAPTIPFKQAPGGKTTFAIMNSDGGSKILSVMTVGYRSSVVFPLSIGAIGLGAVLILLALFLAFRNRKKRKHSDSSKESPSSPTTSSGTISPGNVAIADGASVAGEGSSEANAESSSETAPGGADRPEESDTELAAAAVEESRDAGSDEDSGPDEEDQGSTNSLVETKPVTSAEADSAEQTLGEDGSTDEGVNEGSGTDKENITLDVNDNDKVDSGSTDTSDYDSWFRDGKTK